MTSPGADGARNRQPADTALRSARCDHTQPQANVSPRAASLHPTNYPGRLVVLHTMWD